MTKPLSRRSGRSDVLFLVCESGRRWCDAARRFVGPFQHTTSQSTTSPTSNHRVAFADQPLFQVQPLEPAKVRAMIAGHVAVAILWEISAANTASTALNIAQIGVGRPDALQIVALGEIAAPDAKIFSLQIAELGVSAILSRTEEFATVSRLVRRRFSVGG